LVFSGENVRAETCQALAAVGLVPGAIGAITRAESLPLRLETWDRDHPLFRPFNDPQYGDLRRPAFRACLAIRPEADARTLAAFRGGEPALIEKRLGAGRVLWFSSACDLDWSDWPRSRLYVPLVHQMLRHLAGLTEGGPVREVPLEARCHENEAATPGVFARDGFQEVVNIDPRESESERVAAEQFAERFRFRVADAPEAANEDPSQPQPAEASLGAFLRPNEVWHWVLLGLSTIVLAECFLANRTTA
jgi:hypothetical protein